MPQDQDVALAGLVTYAKPVHVTPSGAYQIESASDVPVRLQVMLVVCSCTTEVPLGWTLETEGAVYIVNGLALATGVLKPIVLCAETFTLAPVVGP